MGDSDTPTSAAPQSERESARAASPSNIDLPPSEIEPKPIEAKPIQTKFIWPPKAPAPDAETIGTAEGRAAARDAKVLLRAGQAPSAPTLQRDQGSLFFDAGPEALRRSGSNVHSRESDSSSLDTASLNASSIDLQPSPADTAPPPSTWRDVLERFERRWLGLIHRSWSTRAQAAGWRPDLPETYCPSCGQDIGRYELDTNRRCSSCRGSRLAWDAFVRLGHHDGLLRDAIHEIKFERMRSLALDLGRELGNAIRDRINAAGLENAMVVVCPVPTTWRRRMSRGIDHAGIIAAGVRDSLGNAKLVRLIRRVHRPSQRDVPPSLRAMNVAGAFKPRRGLVKGAALIVLLDDVRTTGATLSAACRVVRGLSRGSGLGSGRGIPVWAASVAVAGGGGGHSGVG